ncbi:MAG: SUMF1/EgtB/PvdO family nonheme iron enzyme [Cyanobacteria bacterium P01_E01_bin.6]
MASDAVELFFSYSHKDEALRDQLATHLKLLERQGIISSWHDRKIVPGSEWAGDIDHSLGSADIILLLISADFLASDYCWDIEIQKALARHDAGETTVIPVILRPVDWSSAPFARLQALPKNAQSVVTWNPPDLAFMDIAKGIRLKAEELVAARQERKKQAQKQAALEQYRQQVTTYLGSGDIIFIVRENLTDLARSLGLHSADTDAIEAEETAIRDGYRANLDRYGQTFRRALDHESPLSEHTTAQLKERQTLLQLDDSDIQQIEERILRDWHAEKLHQKQQALEKQRQRDLDDAERLRQHQLDVERRARERQQQAVEQRLQQEKAERDRQRQQQEKAKRQEQRRQKRAAAAAQLAQRRQREAEEEANRQATPERSSRSNGQSGISRRRALQLAGFGGGALAIALVGNSLLTQSEPSGEAGLPGQTEPPVVSGTSPDDLSVVEVQSVMVDQQGTIAERTSGQVNVFKEDLGKNIGLDMVQIPQGEFEMGSPPEEEGRDDDDEGPQRRVAVPSFFMGRFPVTQAQYETVMGTNPEATYSDRVVASDKPVVGVDWNAAIAFCEKLSQQTGRLYRLPSEAEWEYACRAGTTTPFHFGETITTDLVNYNGNITYGNAPQGEYRRKSTSVGSFPSNTFGLYDMHGNVWEWCLDHWHENYQGAPTDGSAWIDGGDSDRRLLRGGSWDGNPRVCRAADRVRNYAGFRFINIGFRVVSS